MLQRTLEILGDAVPYLAVAAVMLAVLFALRWILLRHSGDVGEGRLARQLTMVLVTTAAMVLFVLVVPMQESTRSDLLGLLGLLLSASIALASSTFVANAMAGMMLRAVGNFRPGDFVRVGEQFGRVTERGLFHVEIQTEDRDLATLPNIHMVTNPVTVVRSSGTIVSATLSLGYDEPHTRLEPLMLEAATAAELQDPFVQVLELGDFSVTYRVAGFLADVTTLLTARSRLRKRLLDALHGAGVEIVSPAFMNQRQIAPDVRFIPAGTARAARVADAAATAEAIVFDKADIAAARQALREERERLVAGGDGDDDSAARKRRIAEIDAMLEETADGDGAAKA